jgi:hypothetical protein
VRNPGLRAFSEIRLDYDVGNSESLKRNSIMTAYGAAGSPNFESSGDYYYEQGVMAYKNQQYRQAYQNFSQAYNYYSQCYNEMARQGDQRAANVYGKYNNAVQWMNACG